MSDMQNGTIPQQHFEKEVAKVLKAWRDGDWLTLAASSLAHTTLIEPALLAEEPLGDDTRARTLAWMLRWGIDRLRPSGSQSWLGNGWRQYNLLHHYYGESWRVADVAEAFAIADQTFYEWRAQAVGALSHILQHEIAAAPHAQQRHRFAVEQRYLNESAESQAVMRLLALLAPAQQMPIQWLHTILPEHNINAAINSLETHHLTTFDAETNSVQFHQQLVGYVRRQLSPIEQSNWLVKLAELAQSKGEDITAATYLVRAGELRQAAQVIVERWQQIVDRNQATELRSVLQQIPAGAMRSDMTLWAKIQLVAGQLEEALDDLPAAIDAYGNALGASDLLTKAEAYYRRAKAYQRVDLDECLSHFAVCIPLLERKQAEAKLDDNLATLLTKMYIDRAWIFIEDRTDFERADKDLAKAEANISVENSALWSTLYNGQAAIAFRRNESERGIELQQQSWVAARASQQVELMLKAAYNLGTDYIWAGKYTKGLEYLERGYALAQDAGNLQMQGAILKGIGNCNVWQGHLAESVNYYLRAHQIFANPRNPNYLASTCADLVEAYAELEQWDLAKLYFEEGKQISAEMQHHRYINDFQDLASKYPRLITTLTPRQQQVVDFVKTNGAIRRPQYIELIGVSKSQAHRDLEELCQQNILVRTGKGRATRYVRPDTKS